MHTQDNLERPMNLNEFILPLNAQYKIKNISPTRQRWSGQA